MPCVPALVPGLPVAFGLVAGVVPTSQRLHVVLLKGVCADRGVRARGAARPRLCLRIARCPHARTDTLPACLR
eukprot:8459145-Alexandrium_andersonii.AAC.1